MNSSKWSARAIDGAPIGGAAFPSDAYRSGVNGGSLQAHRHLDSGVFVPGLLDALDQPSRPGARGSGRALAHGVAAAPGAARVRDSGVGAGPS